MAHRQRLHSVTFQDAVTGVANGTALDVGGLVAVSIQVEGVVGETITFEGTVDGSTWYAVQAVNVTNGTVATTATADGLYLAPVTGLDQFRCRISTADSGTVTVIGRGLADAPGMTLADVDIQAAEAFTLASGAVASGAYASGSIASGAVASGAVASGAIASGAMAAGSQADGHSATLGTTTDAAASSSVAEDTTARTSISLWKGIKNTLILMNAKFAQATPVVTNATGAAAIATSYAPAAAFWLDSVSLKLSAAGTTAENLTITLNAVDGAAYDVALLTQDLSVSSVTSLLWTPDDGPLLCEAGDAIDVAWPNSEGRTYGLRIVARLA